MKKNVITQATKGQVKQSDRFMDDFFEKLKSEIRMKFSKLSTENAQKFLGNGDQFKFDIRESTIKSFERLSVSNQYADEEVSSNYTYPNEYRGPKPITKQIADIINLFGLDGMQALSFAKNLPTLPDGAEGWFAIPKVSAVGKKHFPAITDPAEQYCEVLKMVHSKVAENRNFTNCREGQITTAHIRQHPRTLSFLEQLESEQQGDILILAVQYGLRHKGKSVRCARETFRNNEFGLGAFAVGCMTLVHPKRHVHWEELEAICPGDEFASVAGSTFSTRAPSWFFNDGWLKFDVCDVSSARGFYSLVSAFVVPQKK